VIEAWYILEKLGGLGKSLKIRYHDWPKVDKWGGTVVLDKRS